jgi:two-component system nitrate/nitrite response regulator NarL
MIESRLVREVQGYGSFESSPESDLGIAHDESTGGRRGSSRSRDADPTVVIASALSESRRRWVRHLQERVTVCEVTERRALERIMASLKPEVLVVDLDLPGFRRVRGLRVVQELSPSTKILALAETPADDEGIVALKAGARGYCARGIDPEHLKRAVSAIQHGEIWAPRKLLPGLIDELLSMVSRRSSARLRPMPSPSLRALTERQRRVAVLIAKGASNKEIASRLSISERTVKAHLTGAFRTVGVSDRLQLALLVQGRFPGLP